MQKKMTVETDERSREYDEDLYDTLIAISVVAKQMARNVQKNKEEKDVQELRTDGKNRQS